MVSWKVFGVISRYGYVVVSVVCMAGHGSLLRIRRCGKVSRGTAADGTFGSSTLVRRRTGQLFSKKQNKNSGKRNGILSRGRREAGRHQLTVRANGTGDVCEIAMKERPLENGLSDVGGTGKCLWWFLEVDIFRQLRKYSPKHKKDTNRIYTNTSVGALVSGSRTTGSAASERLMSRTSAGPAYTRPV